MNDDDASGLWFEDEPGEPTVAEIETPGWTREREILRQKRRKKTLLEKVTNPCKCHGYAATGKNGPRAKHPVTAVDLCACQIRLAFDLAMPNCHPANTCRGLFKLDCTAEDRDHVEWVCVLNLAEWTPVTDRHYLPEKLDGLTVMQAFAMIRAGQEADERKLAETCPAMVELLAARGSGKPERMAAAYDAFRLWVRIEGMKKLGMTEEDIDRFTNPERQRATYTH